jgi:hypothetical protein
MSGTGISPQDLKTMPFGNEIFVLGRSPARTELREIAVEALLHLVVENYTEISASLPLDLLGGLLIKPVEIGIVVGFSGFGEAVVENLTFTRALCLGEETMAVLGEGERFSRAHFLTRSGLYFDKAPAHQIFAIWPHTPFVPAVCELGEILLGDGRGICRTPPSLRFRSSGGVSAVPYFKDRPGLNGRSSVSTVVLRCFGGTGVDSLFAGHVISRRLFGLRFRLRRCVARSEEIF